MGKIPGMREFAPNRRQFMKISAAAGGMLIGLGSTARARGEAFGDEIADHDIFTAWVQISRDNIVTLTAHHSEMGQGSSTALPMLIAEELDVPFENVRWRMAPNGKVWRNRGFGSGQQNTGGSTSTWGSFMHLREAGAMAREMLVEAAAARWGVPAGEITARQGVLTHNPSGNTLTYGDVAEDAAALAPPEAVALRDPADSWLLGTAPARLDVPEKCDGTAIFGTDVVRPNMAVASVRACPAFTGTLKGVDPAPALAIRGVIDVVTTDNAVIVVADNWWQANKGVQALSPEWDIPQTLNDSDIEDTLKQGISEDTNIAVDRGDAATALESAQTVLDVEYRVPYMAHITMEPMNATVDPTGDVIEVWAPTQNQSATAMTAAEIFGDGRPVRVHTTYLGGGFGRRARPDYVGQAAEAAKQLGRPVKLIWSREEDFTHDFYRPAVAMHTRLGLDDQGKPVAMYGRLANQSLLTTFNPRFLRNGVDMSSTEGFAAGPYTDVIENVKVSSTNSDLPVPIGFWRSVGYTQTGFFMESVVDEAAHAAGRDPLEYRREWLQDSPRDLALLNRVAEMSGYGRTLPDGHAIGLSVVPSYGSHCAIAVEVSVPEAKRLKLHKVWCAIDPGFAIHRDMIAQQMEGGIVYGFTAALFGAMSMEQGGMVEKNFDSHRMMLLSEMPPVETAILEGGLNERGVPGGIGELSTPPSFAALTNAVFAASGERIRSLPMSRQGWDIAI